MKNKFALRAVPFAVALTLTMTGCGYVESAIGKAKNMTTDTAAEATPDHTVGTSMIKDEVIKTDRGSYAKVKASPAYLGSLSGGKSDAEMSVDSELSESGIWIASEYDRFALKISVAAYFFDHFIDSPALEGGAEERKEWVRDAIYDGVLSDSAYTKKWAADPDNYPILTTANLIGNPGLKSFINDGGPRMTNATIKFGKAKDFTYGETEDGLVWSIPTTWSVDYRITDETVFDMLRAQNKDSSDAEIRAEMTEEAQDGKGENTLRITGESDFHRVDSSGQGQVMYAVGAEIKYTLESAIKPEFHHKKDAKK